MKRTVRTIGVLGIVYSIAQIGAGIYVAHLYQSLSGTGQVGPMGSIGGTGFYLSMLVIIAGIIGLVSCLGILMLKEWGFILFYIYTLGVGFGNLMQTNSPISQWLPFIVLVLVSIFLAFQERKLFHSVMQAS